MEQLRLVRPEEWADAVRLADLVFRDEDHKSMGLAYPNAFSPALAQSYGAFADGRIVSFVGFVPSVVRIGQAELNVYSIGAVCTHPDYRGKGYISALLELIREHAKQAGAPIILVSGNRGVYERFGCRTFGRSSSFELNAEQLTRLASARDEDARFRPAEPTDWFAIRTLANRREVRFEQSIWDLASMIYAEPTASNAKLRHRVWIAERGGEAAAFAVVAVPGTAKPKGQPSLIEWAGAPELAAGLAAFAAEQAGVESLRITVPWHEGQLLSVLAEAGCACSESKLTGTVAVVDAEALLEQLKPQLHACKAAPSLRFRSAEGGTVLAELDGHSFELSPEQFISLVFDPAPHADSVPAELSAAMAGCFPIPFPYPSGLNFV